MPTIHQYAEAGRRLEAAKHKLRQAIRHLGPRDFYPAEHLCRRAEASANAAVFHIQDARRALLACGDAGASSSIERS